MGDWKRSFSTLHWELGVRRSDIYDHLGSDLRVLWRITPDSRDRPGDIFRQLQQELESLFEGFSRTKQAQSRPRVLLALKVSYNITEDSNLDIPERKPLKELQLEQRQKRLEELRGGDQLAYSTICGHVREFKRYAAPLIEGKLARLSAPPSETSVPKSAPVDTPPKSQPGEPSTPPKEPSPSTQQATASQSAEPATDTQQTETRPEATPEPFPFIQDTWSTHQDEVLAIRALSGGTKDGIRDAAVELFHDGHRIKDPAFDRYGIVGDDRLVLVINDAFVGGITRAKAREALLQLATSGSNFIPSGRWDFIFWGIQDLCRSRNPFSTDLISPRQHQRITVLAAEYQKLSRRCGRLDLGGDWLATRIRERALEIGVALGLEVDHRRPPQEIMAHLVTMDAIDRTDLTTLYRSHPASLQQTARTRLATDNRDLFCGACRHKARDVLFQAPAVPASFWDSPEMQATLATRHMGKVVQAFREHPHHGRRISQTTAAGWLYLTQSRLSRIESGPPMHDLHRLTQIAHILSIPRHLLWFAPIEETEPREPAPSAAPPLPVEKHNPDGHTWRVVSEMLRRTFLQGGLAALASADFGNLPALAGDGVCATR